MADIVFFMDFWLLLIVRKDVFMGTQFMLDRCHRLRSGGGSSKPTDAQKHQRWSPGNVFKHSQLEQFVARNEQDCRRLTGIAGGDALILIHIYCDGYFSEMPRKRRVKESGRLALQPMGRERMAASVPDFATSLANAGKMPAPLEAGASRMLS
jgi:hypothetical protein